MSSYKLISLTDDKIIEGSYGEVKSPGDYSLKGTGNLANRRDFIKSRAIAGGMYDPAIFGMVGYCKCQRTRVVSPNEVTKCNVCGVPVAGSESAQEKIYGHYVLPYAIVNPIMLGNLSTKLEIRGWRVPVDGSAASPYDLLKSICMYSYTMDGPKPINDSTDLNTIGLDGLYNIDEDFRSTLSKLIVVPSTVYRPCYPKRNKETGDIELVMAGDTKLGTKLSGIINFCEEIKKRDVTNVSTLEYAILKFNFVWLMYLYHASSPILQGGKFHSTRDLTRSTIESSIRATISPLLDSDLNIIRVPRGLAYNALDEDIKNKLMEDYGYTSSEANQELLNNTELANEAFMDIIKNKTICLFWRNPTLYKNSVVAMYPEVWDEPSIGIPIEQCFTGDTKIKLLDGTIVEIKDLINNYEGKYVYSRDEFNNLVPGKIVNAFKSGETSELIELEFDCGTIKCTPDHKFRLSDGSYVKAKDLTEDMEISSYILSESQANRTLGYEVVTDEYNNSDLTFHLIGGKTEYGQVIHHRDFNYKNNNPENLIIMNTKDHAKLHITAYNKSDEHKEQFKTKDYTEYSKRMSEYNKSEAHRNSVSERNSRLWKNEEYADMMQSHLNSPKARRLKGIKCSLRAVTRRLNSGVKYEDLWDSLQSRGQKNFDSKDQFYDLFNIYKSTGEVRL